MSTQYAQIKTPQVTYIYTIYLKTFIYTTSRSIKNKFYLHMIRLKKVKPIIYQVTFALVFMRKNN